MSLLIFLDFSILHITYHLGTENENCSLLQDKTPLSTLKSPPPSSQYFHSASEGFHYYKYIILFKALSVFHDYFTFLLSLELIMVFFFHFSLLNLQCVNDFPVRISISNCNSPLSTEKHILKSLKSIFSPLRNPSLGLSSQFASAAPQVCCIRLLPGP